MSSTHFRWPLSILLMAFLLGPRLKAAESSTPSSALAELNATCKPSEAPEQAELAVWKSKSQELQTASDSGAALELPSQTKVELALHKSKQITWPLTPEKVHLPASSSYGGIAKFKVTKNAVFKVSLDQKAWIDIVDVSTKKAVKATHFEKQPGCSSIAKSVDFALQAHHSYFLQISSSPKDTISLMITSSQTGSI